MRVVILAGGLGSRISEETRARPKPMVEIGGRPMLWHIMKLYAHHGMTDFVICGGYRGYVIKEYFANMLLHNSDVSIDLASDSISYHDHTAEPWKVCIVDTGEETLTGGRIKRVRHLLGEEEAFCLTYGDGVADVDMKALTTFHRDHGMLVTVTAVAPPGRFGALDIEDGRVTSFREKPDQENGQINGGFFVVEPKAIDVIAGDESSWELDVLPRLAAEGQLFAYRHTGFWAPMDTPRDKKSLDQMWRNGKAPWKIWRDG